MTVMNNNKEKTNLNVIDFWSKYKILLETVHNNTGEEGGQGEEETDDVKQEELLVEVKLSLDILVLIMLTWHVSDIDML